ncbi:hypothetical protein, partial [Bacteroides zoogleoformans]|uniref:hypothetical protein n=1 Tax=Bacteroides zoogleoformans TaxID=28119 RepID=UPI00248F0C56
LSGIPFIRIQDGGDLLFMWTWKVREHEDRRTVPEIKMTLKRRFYSKRYIIRIIICIFVARINRRSFGKV